MERQSTGRQGRQGHLQRRGLMSKILVKASPQIQIGPDGKPQMYYNVGFGGRRGGGDGARGRTKRSRVLGAGGAALGALGGLAGGSRSLGGFLSNVQVGAMQGSAAGRGLADALTSRRRQELANLQEQSKVDRAKEAAQRDFQRRQDLNPERLAAEGPRLTSLLNPMNINRRRFDAEQARLQQARETNTAAEQLGRELAQEASGIGRARLAQDKRDAKARGISLPEHRATAAAYEMAQNVGPEEVANLQRLIGAGLAPTQTLGQGQQPQVPQGQIPPAEGGAQTQSDANNNAMGTGPQAVQTHVPRQVENAEDEVREQQGGRGEEGDSEMLNRLRVMMEGENE